MTPDGLPEGIIIRFRTLSLERVSKVESTWNSILAGVYEPSAIRDVMRELHTLKGDSRIVGFDEIHTLAHKLEELFALASQMHFRMSEDLELVITLALQFTGLLLKRKHATSTSGIDLPGFVRQVDEVLRESRTMPLAPSRTATITKPGSREIGGDRLSDPVRHRFAIAATGAFLEYLSARSSLSRRRLRSVWTMLRDELSALSAISLASLLERHVTASAQLAADLGKKLELAVEVGDLYVDGRVAEALDVALLHLVRNAIDHGIEKPAVRTAAGKPEVGALAIRARVHAGMIEVSVEDDGAGIDLAGVRASVVERGMLTADRAARSADAEIFEYLFQSGFSTRKVVSETSGRGIGLDAVKTALTRAGGAVRIDSDLGQRTTIVLEAPATIRQLRAYQFLAPGGLLSFAVSARWDPTVETGPVTQTFDPMTVLQLPSSSRQTIPAQREPMRELGLRLRWGFLDVVLKASSPPVLVTVDRICPTPEDYPVEIVLVDGRETILLRPEHVAAAATARGA